MVLKVYGAPLSEPTRAVMAFLKLNNIPFEFIYIDLFTGQQRSPEYLAINPCGKVPAIDDDGFLLFESHAILTYIQRSRSLPDHWYPSDTRSRALVDRYLHWHHSNLRVGESLIFAEVIAPILGVPVDSAKVEMDRAIFLRSLDTINLWLGTTRFLAGEEISIADLSAACEIAEHRLRALDLTQWSHIQEWMDRVFALPEVAEVHQTLDEFLKKQQEKSG